MKNIIQYLTEDKFSDYENKAAEHIIDVLKDYIDLSNPESKDSHWNAWVRFTSSIKKSDIDNIHKELRKVLASHEISIGERGLSVNIFKEPQLSITEKDSNKYVVYFKGKVKTYYEKNIK